MGLLYSESEWLSTAGLNLRKVAVTVVIAVVLIGALSLRRVAAVVLFGLIALSLLFIFRLTWRKLNTGVVIHPVNPGALAPADVSATAAALDLHQTIRTFWGTPGALE